jgi:thiol-disulfide isomerase/thioredoxin
MRRLLPAVLCLGLLTAACTGPDGPSGGSPTSATPTTGRASPPIEALNATTAPLLPTDAAALPDVDPDSFDTLLTQLKGTPVLVNFWASWCGPCTREAPHLKDAAESYGDRVQFLGIDILDDRPSAREFMADYGWRYPSLFDVPGAVRDGVGEFGQPVTIIYDAAGQESFRTVGQLSPGQLDAELQKVL